METNNANALLTDLEQRDYSAYDIKLYKAAMTGNWEEANEIYRDYPIYFAKRITKKGDTALHVAAISGKVHFVSQLVPIMKRMNLLSCTNHIGNTALSYAAMSGTVASAEAMVNEDANLPKLRNNEGLTPLHIAAMMEQGAMVNYLYNYTKEGLNGNELISLFISVINADLYDIALRMINDDRDLAIKRDDETKETPLHVLARKSCKSYGYPEGFWSTCFNNKCKNKKTRNEIIKLVEVLWTKIMQQNTNEISLLMARPWRLLFGAVEVGNVEFVTTLINQYPDLLWKMDNSSRTIFHVAVKFRQEAIFRLIFEIGAMKDLLVIYVDDNTKDSILHLAAYLPANDRLNCVSGAALQMQREMLWFKVVESILPSQDANAKNKKGMTAQALFTKQHKQLRKEGEEWLRKTAGSCSVVAALITGVVFGAALKISGTDNGWHWFFTIFNSLSLISSTTSILMFLSIMTSRYAEKNFLKSLPRKLILGLTFLFISIVSMMLAFAAIVQIMFNVLIFSIVILILSVASIILFGCQVFPLFWAIFRSNFGSSNIFKHKSQLFCSQSQIDSRDVMTKVWLCFKSACSQK